MPRDGDRDRDLERVFERTDRRRWSLRLSVPAFVGLIGLTSRSFVIELPRICRGETSSQNRSMSIQTQVRGDMNGRFYQITRGNNTYDKSQSDRH